MKDQTLPPFTPVCFSETKDSAVQKSSKSKNNKKSKRAILFKLHSPFSLLRKHTVPKFSVSKLRQRKPKQYIQWLARRDLRNSITQVNSMWVIYGVMLLAKSKPNINVCGHQLVKWGNKNPCWRPHFLPTAPASHAVSQQEGELLGH